MKCPDCNLALLTIEVEGVELDYCDDRHGTWFDEGEIEAFLRSNGPVLSYDKGAVGKRRCPRCGARMRVVMANETVELDLCPMGCGVWFDDGEIGVLAAHFGQSNSQIGDAFGRLAQRLGEA